MSFMDARVINKTEERILNKMASDTAWTNMGYKALKNLNEIGKRWLREQLKIENSDDGRFSFNSGKLVNAQRINDVFTNEFYFEMSYGGSRSRRVEGIGEIRAHKSIECGTVLDEEWVDKALEIYRDVVDSSADIGKLKKRFVGGKTTKFMNFLIGETRMQELSKIIQSSTVDNETVYVSTRPIDFIRMSHGNSWTSCHDTREERNSYKRGCTGLAHSKHQFICYTEASNDTLKWRIVGSVSNDGHITFTLGYPNNNDDLMIKIAEEIGKRIGVDFKRVGGSGIDHDSAYGYEGYNDEVYYEDVFINPSKDIFHTNVAYGDDSVCLVCGDKGYINDNMACGCCDDNDECYVCGERHSVYALYEVIGVNDTYGVCDGCLTDSDCIVRCNDCGSHMYKNASFGNSDNDIVCEDCFNNRE